MVELINKAIMFAVLAHENQTRKGTDIPYILHPLEAALIVSKIKCDDDLICSALLHDTAEDSRVSCESIAEMFNKRIAGIVSFQSEDKSKSWKERKQHTLNELKKLEDDGIKIVCLADKLSNMRAIRKDFDSLGDKLWERFNEKDKNEHAWYYKGIADGLSSLSVYPAYKEFKELVDYVFDSASD
jgi:myo-inositol-1(or 4)-monophosphatase